MPDEILSLRKAAAVANVSHELVRQWCLKHGVGEQEGKRWRVSKDKLVRMAKTYHKAMSMLGRAA